MSKTASKPLPSKKTPAQARFARPAAGCCRRPGHRRDRGGAARPPRRGGRGRLAGGRPGRLGGPGRRGIGRRGGRCRGGANRRRRPDRRSDPHLLDADGRNPHAQPRARNGPGPAHPVQPQAVPPQHAGDGLHVAGGGGPAGEHSRRPRAAGSHHRGLGDQPPREAAAVEAAGSQRRTRSNNLMRRNREDFLIAIHKGRPSQAAPRRHGSGWCAGGAGPCGWWKNSACGPGDCSPPWTT